MTSLPTAGRKPLLGATLLTASLLLASGCGGGAAAGPDTVDVSGTVTLGGQPLGGATIYFMTDAFTGVAQTADDGTYKLSRGAVPGMNKVYVTKIEGGTVAADPESGMDAEQFRAMHMATQGEAPAQPPPGELAREVVPVEYSDPSQTTLTFDVPEEGTSTADFKL